MSKIFLELTQLSAFFLPPNQRSPSLLPQTQDFPRNSSPTDSHTPNRPLRNQVSPLLLLHLERFELTLDSTRLLQIGTSLLQNLYLFIKNSSSLPHICSPKFCASPACANGSQDEASTEEEINSRVGGKYAPEETSNRDHFCFKPYSCISSSYNPITNQP